MPETTSKHSSARPPRAPSVAWLKQTNPGDSTVLSSQMSAVTPSGTPFISESDGEFELMHVKVTVLGLTGIVCETATPKKRKPSLTKTARAGDNFKNTPISRNTQGSTVSSLSSTDGSTFSDRPLCHNHIPTVAVVAFQRNVTNSETVIATHLPSHPLGMPVSSFGSLYRYIAHWPTESDSFVQQNGEVDRASFTLLRVMMRDAYATSDLEGARVSYATETIDIHIGLSRGKDMIPLGVASIVITGDEEGAELMVLPAKPLSTKGKSMVLGSGGKKRRPRLFKSMKKASFPDDPSKTFRLDENASLRVMVKVLPSHAVIATEAALADKEEAREATDQLPGDQEDKENKAMNKAMKLTAHLLEPLSPKGQADGTAKPSFFNRSLFCGCAPLGQEASSRNEIQNAGAKSMSTGDYSVDNKTMDSLARQHGASFNSSDVSSVSESESETESEYEQEEVHLNRDILVRRKPSFRKQKSNKEIQAARATLRKQAHRLGVKPKDLL